MNIKFAAKLAMLQPRRFQLKRTIFVGESIRPLQGSNGILIYPQDDSKTEQTDGNGNASYLDVIDMSGVVKTTCKQGRLNDALQILHRMDVWVDSDIYVSLLQGCFGKSHGSLIHAHMIQTGFKPNLFLGNTLMIMYTKCGSLVDARRVFDEMPKRNVVSWTAMIAAYARRGFSEEALRMYYQMEKMGVQPNQFTFASVLPACAGLAALDHGKEVHEDISRSGLESNVFVGSALVDMYVKCGCIEDARQVFDKMPQRNVVSWNAMIGGYAQNGRFDEALRMFQQMPERDVVSWNALVAGYAQDGNVEEALKLFYETPERDVVSWTTVITACAQNGYGEKALVLFCQMQQTGIQSNQFTFTGVLQACSNLGALNHGREIHAEIVRRGLQDDVFVGSALVYMYGKSGSLENAHRVFDKMPDINVVSWNAIIVGYAQNGCLDEALKLFEKIPEQTVVSWNAMIAGYAQNGYFDEAVNFFQQMQLTGLKPNPDTFASILPAFSHLAALEQGKRVHEYTIRSGFQHDVFVGSALVDMYAKCGSIEDARKLFDNMPRRDVVLWTAMIVGYSMHGYGKEALQIFAQMEESGMKPSRVTFIGVLSACCHAGLVDRGWQYFERMTQYYYIAPVMEHYCCIVDLLGRAGFVDEAHDFINKMPIKPEPAVWGSLLGACRIHGNIGLGEHVAERLFELDPQKPATYVLLSNIYAAAGRWNDIEKVRKLMKDRGVKKMPGCSWIEINKKMYSFLIGDRSHPQTEEIYAELERLSGQMKEVGYEPNRMFALNDVEEEQKEHILGHHSEKLAIAFGLINTTPGMPIRVIKNLRVCGDCHSAIKLISKIVVRDIVVRDANRFHHFKDGSCSCGDYW